MAQTLISREKGQGIDGKFENSDKGRDFTFPSRRETLFSVLHERTYPVTKGPPLRPNTSETKTCRVTEGGGEVDDRRCNDQLTSPLVWVL